MRLGLMRQLVYGGLDQGCQICRLATQVQCLRVSPGQEQKIGDQPDETVGFAFYRLEETVAHLGIVYRSIAQGFHHALYGRQRGAQFVGHVGHKVNLHLAGGPQAGGHIVKGPAQAA